MSFSMSLQGAPTLCGTCAQGRHLPPAQIPNPDSSELDPGAPLSTIFSPTAFLRTGALVSPLHLFGFRCQARPTLGTRGQADVGATPSPPGRLA